MLNERTFVSLWSPNSDAPHVAHHTRRPEGSNKARIVSEARFGLRIAARHDNDTAEA